MNAQIFRETVAAYIRISSCADPETGMFLDLGRVLELCALLEGTDTTAQKIVKVGAWARDPVQPWYGSHKAEREKVLWHIYQVVFFFSCLLISGQEYIEEVKCAS